MTRKPTTAAVGDGNRKMALEGLKKRQDQGTIPADDTVLSVSDHGNVIIVYTQHASFGLVKDKSNAKSSSAG